MGGKKKGKKGKKGKKKGKFAQVVVSCQLSVVSLSLLPLVVSCCLCCLFVYTVKLHTSGHTHSVVVNTELVSIAGKEHTSNELNESNE